ncbi:OLC1v1034052C1 [Oldenlandia corymbosa var. corymbosa]|uniref:Protein FAR1-RELATED SEQUENCE n=1 Tax=Oldenlandia corymbosa var. corymbosa TaxID=529605 RepID=A0AAV1CPS8_OLDCO|nr:OLC1v1034052C1 [Oldenlandia corymbosa var. corymbosa]
MEAARFLSPVVTFETAFRSVMEALVLENAIISERLLIGIAYLHAFISGTCWVVDSFPFKSLRKEKKAEGESVDDNRINDDAGRNHPDANGENGGTFGGEWHDTDGGDDNGTHEDGASDQDGEDDDESYEDDTSDEDGEEDNGENDGDDSYGEDEDYDDKEVDEESEDDDEENGTVSDAEDEMDDDPLLSHAREVFAPDSFSWFSHEYEKSRPIYPEAYGETGLEFKYTIEKMGCYQNHSHKVHSEPFYGVVTCCCNHFAVTGMLCSHALVVLECFHIKQIPDKYIPKWRLKSWHQSSTEEQFSKRRQLRPSLDDCLSGELGRRTNASEEAGTSPYWHQTEANKMCSKGNHFGLPILRHAKEIFTSGVYSLFRDEYRKSEYLITTVEFGGVDRRGLVYEFQVHRHRRVDIQKQYMVPKLLKVPNLASQQSIHGPKYRRMLELACYRIMSTESTTLLTTAFFGPKKDSIAQCALAVLTIENELRDLPPVEANKGNQASRGIFNFRGKCKFWDDQLIKNFSCKESETLRGNLFRCLKW